MKTKVIALLLLAGASAFAQTRFSIQFGSRPAYRYAQVYDGYGADYGYGSGYGYDGNSYARQRVYTYAPGYGGAGYGGAGYWGGDLDRAHRAQESRGLRNHHEQEFETYGNSRELRQHQVEEQRELRHEQWHERNGDVDAARGQAHGSAYDGMRRW